MSKKSANDDVNIKEGEEQKQPEINSGENVKEQSSPEKKPGENGKDVAQKPKLIDIFKLMADKTSIKWRQEAFMQFAGLKKGKSMFQEEFDKLWDLFEKKYGGGKK